jgi:phosphate transport system protein
MQWRKLINLWKEDDLLQQAWHQSCEMLIIDQEMYQAAVDMLRHSSGTDLAAEVRGRDGIVDAYEQDVRRKVLTHCAIRGPSDVPGGMTLVAIVTDIERIGDYVRHIIDLAVSYPGQLSAEAYEGDLVRVEEAVLQNLIETRACVESSSESEAARLLERYTWIKQTCYDRIMDLVRSTGSTMPGGQAAALALYFRWLKRINAHLLNITSSVISPTDHIAARTSPAIADRPPR